MKAHLVLSLREVGEEEEEEEEEEGEKEEEEEDALCESVYVVQQ